MIKIRYILTTRINGNVCTCTRYMYQVHVIPLGAVTCSNYGNGQE